MRFLMRPALAFFGAITCATLGLTANGQAATYPWCAYYGHDLDGTNCGFVSYSQCMAAVSGNGGTCMHNAQYRGSSQPAPRQRRNH